MVDASLGQPVVDCVRCANLSVNEIGYARAMKSKPYAPLQSIRKENADVIVMSQVAPGDLLDFTFAPQMKKTELLIGEPHIPSCVLINSELASAGNASYGNKPAFFPVADATKCSNPDSSVIILK